MRGATFSIATGPPPAIPGAHATEGAPGGLSLRIGAKEKARRSGPSGSG